MHYSLGDGVPFFLSLRLTKTTEALEEHRVMGYQCHIPTKLIRRLNSST
jgi:hypothetical protein